MSVVLREAAVLGLTPRATLKVLGQPWIQEAARLGRGEPVRLYGEFVYQAGGWSGSRRVIVKAESTALGPNTRFIWVRIRPVSS